MDRGSETQLQVTKKNNLSAQSSKGEFFAKKFNELYTLVLFFSTIKYRKRRSVSPFNFSIHG